MKINARFFENKVKTVNRRGVASQRSAAGRMPAPLGLRAVGRGGAEAGVAAPPRRSHAPSARVSVRLCGAVRDGGSISVDESAVRDLERQLNQADPYSPRLDLLTRLLREGHWGFL